ncbi:MAG: copper resistance protein CopC [Chloroflexi bacterium]|nr:copper resistance protein CopC [Chloroflexota bacterium]
MSWRNLKLAAGIVLASLMLTSLALSHGNLQSAKPGPGETVSQSPETIELTFNEPIQSGTITLVQTGGNAIPLTPVEATSPDMLVAEVDETLADGEYNVLWMVTSEDNHIINGSYSFAVSTQEEDFPSILAIIGGIGLIMLVVGGLLLWRGRFGSERQ